MFYITFNNMNNRTLGIEVTTRPSIPAPSMRGEYVQVAGRDGSLLMTDGTYENIEIQVSMNFLSPRFKWGDAYRRAKNWLHGPGILRMSDDADVFYKVKACGISSTDRAAKNGGKIEAVFVCDPFTYYNSGTVGVTPEKAKFNPYYTARPIYTITGNGLAVLSVNGNEMTADINSSITIDTDKMLAYNNNLLMNTNVTGDYEGLVLLPGENEIEITSGFDLRIIPNYRAL